VTGESNKRLRTLTDEFFNGVIDRNYYLTERGNLLDSLVGFEPVGSESAHGETTAADTTVPKEAAVAVPAPLEAEESVLQSQSSHSGSRMGVVAGIVVAVAAGVIFVFWPGDEPAPAKAPAELARGATVEQTREQTPSVDESLLVVETERLTGLERVSRFLDEPRWSEEETAAFVFNWDLLSTAQREELRQSELFGHFTGEVRDRIKVDKALGSTAFVDGMSLAEVLSVELGLGLVDWQAAGTAQPADIPAAGSAGAPETIAEFLAEPIPAPVSESNINAKPADELTVTGVDEPADGGAMVTSAGGSVVATEIDVEAVPEAVAPAVIGQTEVEEKSGSVPVVRNPSERPCSVKRLNFRSSTCWDMLTTELRGPVLRVVPGGRFQMGQAGDVSATPVHEQIIAKPFAVGTFEISVGEFEYYCSMSGRDCPIRRWAGDEYPVVDIDWQQAVAYTNWLTETTGAKYRLPTEAEWEYVARAGTTTRYPFGDKVSPAYARFDNGMRTLSPLPISDRTTRYNGFRLWHLSGNVREWTVDLWRNDYASEPDPGQRVVRGGSYAEPANRLRSAARSGEKLGYFDAKTGFRVVRELVVE